MLEPGINVTTGEDEKLEKSLTVLEFLRYIRQGETIPAELTITGLESLLQFSEDPEETADWIRRQIRDGMSDGAIQESVSILQFVVDSDVIHDRIARLRVSSSETINIERLSAQKFEPSGQKHVHADK
jgi:hypothetical protein